MGFMEELKAFIEANVKKIHPRGLGPLGDSAVETNGFRLGRLTYISSRK